MITRLEATRYRCFERLGVDVGDFRVLVGANGSGKTTLLDLPVLLGDLLRANNVSAPFMERRPELPPRAGSLNELVFAGRGSDFSLAVEARLPEAVQSKVLEGLFASKRTERSRQALQEDRRQWPTHIRYEIGLRIGADQSLLVAYEYLFLFPEADGPDRRQAGFHGATAANKKLWHLTLKREIGYESEFKPETPHAKAVKVGLPETLLAMPRVLFESEVGYPAARWLHSLLTTDAVFLEPNWSAMRQASPPGQPKVITANGRNIPWLALELKREGLPKLRLLTIAVSAMPTGLPMCKPRCRKSLTSKCVSVRTTTTPTSWSATRATSKYRPRPFGWHPAHPHADAAALPRQAARHFGDRRARKRHPSTRHRGRFAVALLHVRQPGVGVLAFARGFGSRQAGPVAVRTAGQRRGRGDGCRDGPSSPARVARWH